MEAIKFHFVRDTQELMGGLTIGNGSLQMVITAADKERENVVMEANCAENTLTSVYSVRAAFDAEKVVRALELIIENKDVLSSVQIIGYVDSEDFEEPTSGDALEFALVAGWLYVTVITHEEYSGESFQMDITYALEANFACSRRQPESLLQSLKAKIVEVS